MAKRALSSGLALLLLLSIAACSSHNDSVGHINMPASSSDFEGEDFRDVVSDLREAGFTNVTTKALGDLILGWLKRDGSVKEVEVDGDSVFGAHSRYPRAAEIVVSYHSFPDEGENPNASDEEPAEDSGAIVPESAVRPGVRSVGEAEARWLEIMMITKPLDLLSQEGYDRYAPLHAIQPGWGGSTDGYLRITVQEPLDVEDVRRLGINVLNLIGPEFRDIVGIVFTDSTGIDHNFFRRDAPGADLG